MSKPAGRRNTRLNSKSQPIVEELTELETKRSVLVANIRKLEKQFVDNDIFSKWSKGDLTERMKRLEALGSSLNDNHMEMVCKNELNTDIEQENEILDELVMRLKAKASDQIDKIIEANKPKETQAAQSHNIRVIQTDAAGNIPNTWGTFSGDYAKWHTFRDRWLPIHRNDEIKAITKFQALKAACIGEAAGALGEWDLTEDNYHKAFSRLSSIFEDDYMQIQAYMQKLIRLPRMKSNSSRMIRKMIDTVQQHIAGASRYIDIDEKQPYAVFTVIDKMDSETFRAWEKHRPTLAKAIAIQNNAEEIDGDNDELHIKLHRIQANTFQHGKSLNNSWKGR